MRMFEFVLQWTVRLAPGLVMASLLFALDGNLRWIGLMGLPMLALAFANVGCACSARHGAERQPTAFPGI